MQSLRNWIVVACAVGATACSSSGDPTGNDDLATAPPNAHEDRAPSELHGAVRIVDAPAMRTRTSLARHGLVLVEPGTPLADPPPDRDVSAGSAPGAHLTFHGGKVVAHPAYTAIYWGSTWSSTQAAEKTF